LPPAKRPGARTAERRQDRTITPKRYETAILFDPELPEDQRKEFLGKLSGVVASFQGEVLKTDDWGNRKLAYQIRKRSNAFYTFLLYTGTRGVVEEVERNIKIFDGILRHLPTVHTATLPPAKPAAAQAEAPAPPETPAPEAPPAPAGQ
jgi:small subunit ribosomal protein S6